MGLWAAFLAFAQDPWAGVKAWRERRDAAVPKKSKPTYDPYPDRIEIPSIRMYVEARDVLGRIRREYVDLRGYGLEHVNLESVRWREDIVKAIKVARTVLTAKLRLAHIHKTRRDAERGEEAFEQAVKREQRGGQAVVEFALILPVLMAVLLGVAWLTQLNVHRPMFQSGIQVLTDLAARDGTGAWHSKVGSEDARTKCNGGQPDVLYPDGNQDPGSRVHLIWHCSFMSVFGYTTPVDVQWEAVIQ